MLWSLLFAALFSLLVPNLKDDYPVLGIYYDVYRDVRRDLNINRADKKVLNKEFGKIKKDAFRYVKKISKLNKSLAVIDNNYSSTIDDYRKTLDSISTNTDSLITLGVTAHELLAKELTEEQWNEAFSKFNKYIDKLDGLKNNLIKPQ